MRVAWIAAGAVAALLAALLLWRDEPSPPRATSRGNVHLPERSPDRPPSPRGRTIRGRVVSAGSGRPVVGASVIVDGHHVRATDAAGEFEAPGDQHVDQVSLRITSSTHRSLRTRRPLGRERIQIELEPGLCVAGRVLSADGDPVPGYHLWSIGQSEAWTGPDGRFRTGGHPPGPVKIALGDTEMEVEAGDEDVTIVLEGPYLFVRTVDDLGEPVRGVCLVRAAPGRRTVAGGSAWQDYLLIGFEPGQPVEVELTREGFLPTRLDWVPRSAALGVSSEVVVMRRRPPNSLRIDVRRADGLTPRSAHFTLLGPGGLVLISERIELVDGRGRVESLPEGSYLARVHADHDTALAVEQGVEIRPGDDNDARFDMRPGAVVAVRWTQYASRYRLELRDEADEKRRFYFGKYKVQGWWGASTRIPPGRYRLRELRDRDVIREAPVEVVGTDRVVVDWSADE